MLIQFQFMKAGTVMSNYTSVLTLILRLRQGLSKANIFIHELISYIACNHPTLVTKSFVEEEVVGPASNNSDHAKELHNDAADSLADMLSSVAISQENSSQTYDLE